VEVAYVGSRSHRLSYQIGNINRNNVVTANLGKIQALNDAGWGSYNSLQVKVTKRVSRNLDFLAAYTYGHNIDNGPSPFNLGHINSDNPQDPHNLNQEIASADDDIRHSFVFSGLYRLPIGRGQAFFSNWGRMPELLLGGWQFNGIFRSQTGTPINIIRNGSNVGYEGLRPNLIGKPGLPNGQRTLDVYFNNFVCKPSNPPQPCPSNAAWDVSPFVMNSSNAVGNAGRNLITGPGFVNADTSLFKDFEIKEGMKLQTRLEAFNTFNTPHFSNPGGDIGDSSSFGKITRTYGNMRIMQLAVKFIF